MFPFARDGPRPWLAAVLAFVVPGLGHVYQRRLTRALGWFATYLVAFVLFVPAGDAATLAEGVQAGATMTELGLSPTTFLPPTAVGLLCVVDAYALARRRGGAEGDEAAASPPDAPSATAGAGEGSRPTDCAHCGRELDVDVDFCPWCGAEDPTVDGDGGRSLLS